MALGLGLRLAAARDDFWFDEIWSYFIAKALPGWLSIVTGVHHDNNHYLNTLFLYLLGEQTNWFLYRVPAIVAGTAAVVLAGVALRPLGRIEALTATALSALSYPMIQYSSEARGYAFAVAAALGCYVAGSRYRASPTALRGAALWTTACLGLLSHLTFFLFLAALLVWLAVQAREDGLAARRAIAYVSLGLGPALALAILLWWLTVRLTQIGGGPDAPFLDALIYSISYSCGGPESGPAALAISAVAVAVILGGVRRLWGVSRSDAVLFVVSMLLPLAALGWRQAAFVHPRYFLIAIAFALLSASICIGALWESGDRRRWLALALALLTLGGNAVHLVQFLRIGRGGYFETIRYIWEHSPEEEIVVSGDHAMRVPYLLAFYGRLLPGKRFRYVDSTQLAEAGAPWMLLHRFDDKPLPDEVRDRFKNRYRLVRKAPFYGLSGWYWYLYDRVANESPP